MFFSCSGNPRREKTESKKLKLEKTAEPGLRLTVRHGRQTWVQSLRLRSQSEALALTRSRSWSQNRSFDFLKSRSWSPGVWQLLKRPLFYLIYLIFTEIQANCSGQNGLKGKTVDIFSFWDHKGKVEDLTFLDHKAEAFWNHEAEALTSKASALWSRSGIRSGFIPMSELGCRGRVPKEASVGQGVKRE